MGISGLLPTLRSIHKPVNLKKFDGQTIAVDAYGWLHRGAVTCTMELATGKPTRKYVDFFMHRVRMLQHFGVVPYLVFDGDYLPSKALTEKDRAIRRNESHKLGMELLKVGKTTQALAELQKSVDVTPEMASQVIMELRRAGVQYVVAPYEADAQMAYLERTGVVQAVISEDSDLLVFGTSCLLTKLDQYGSCVEINRADFSACREISLTGWTDAEFRLMAILSGCDYLASINGMGLKTAHRLVRKHKTAEKIIRMLQFDGKFHVPKDYLKHLQQAELTFLHQRVYCTKSHTLVLNTPSASSADEETMPFIGAYVDKVIAQGVARGDLHPTTKQPFSQKSLPYATRTPSSIRSHAVHATSAENLKKGTPLEHFFRPRRVPLAELDPNCFTPSPTQQDLLARNGNTFQSSASPRPYLQRSTTEASPPQRSSTANSISAVRSPAPNTFEVRPNKRARLCQDTLSPRKAGDSMAQSRFFATTAQQSPSLNCGPKLRRAKTSEVTIFTDDLDATAKDDVPTMNPVGQISATPQSGKVQQMPHGIVSVHHSAPTDVVCQVDVATLAVEHSRDSTRALIADRHIAEESTPIAIQAGIKAKGLPASITQYTMPTPPSTISSRTSRIPVFKKTDATRSQDGLSTFRAFTPLQRLGATARNMTPYTPPEGTPLPRLLGSAMLKKRGSFSTPLTSQASNTAQPAMVPLPPPDKAEMAFLSEVDVKGSEDQIIPDSEGEHELSSPVSARTEEVVRSRPLNLGRFKYAGMEGGTQARGSGALFR